MARRSDSNKSNTNKAQGNQAPAEPTTEETAVSTATEETAPTEAVEPTTTESTEPKADSKPAEKPVDLTAFKNAVSAGVEAKDDETGTIPTGPLSEITVAYRQLEGAKAKNRAKDFVNDEMKTYMGKMDMPMARAYLQISEEALVAGGPKAERVPADPTEAFVQKVVTLDLARAFATQPDGLAEDVDTRRESLYNEAHPQVEQYIAWLNGDAETRGDEPQVSAVVRNAAKLATGKQAKAGSTRSSNGAGYTGERRETAKHIEHAFADKEPGTFLSISEIRNIKSPEYGDDLPSAGAISMRLFPGEGKKCTLEGVVPATNAAGKKGGKKV